MANKAVTITVTATGGVVDISVSDPNVSVHGFDGIEWTFLNSPNWEFAEDDGGDSMGIVIKQPNKKFKNKRGRKTKHIWERVTADRKQYFYTINVVNTNKPDVIVSMDPAIMND